MKRFVKFKFMGKYLPLNFEKQAVLFIGSFVFHFNSNKVSALANSQVLAHLFKCIYLVTIIQTRYLCDRQFLISSLTRIT